MTFSIGTTPAAASPPVTASNTRPETGERRAPHVAERRKDGVLGERAGLAGIGDRVVGDGHGRGV